MKCDERKRSKQYDESHLNMFCSCYLGSITHRPVTTTYAEESSRDTIEQDTKIAFCISRKPTLLTNANLIFSNSCTTSDSVNRFSYTAISVEPSCLKQSSGSDHFSTFSNHVATDVLKKPASEQTSNISHKASRYRCMVCITWADCWSMRFGIMTLW